MAFLKVEDLRKGVTVEKFKSVVFGGGYAVVSVLDKLDLYKQNT